MAASIKRILQSRRINHLFKFIALSAFFWWIIYFGFNQDVSTDFGEHLDRNKIEELSKKLRKVTKTTLKEERGDKSDETSESKSDQCELENEAPEKDEFRFEENWRKPVNIFGRENLGEQGIGVIMPENVPSQIQDIYDDGWKKNSFNQYLSDLISVHRSLPDFRSDYCREISKYYHKNLPKTSVIIIFHNEAWSTLLRSVHSVLDRSPPHLIEEIILVDDFSDMEHLKVPLDEYISRLPKLKILRATERIGLIRARMMGAVAATGEVLTFLDSHIECTEGWLEPLLDRIASNPTNVVCPIVGVIDPKTFNIRSQFTENDLQLGGFDWDLTFRWFNLPEREKQRKKNPWDPTQSPTMPGGLFSIDKAFFKKLGMYDPEFDIWGGENLEISFKTWMCGGTLEFLPCSHVQHVFRSKSPYTWRPGSDVVRRNLIRLAEVWMDEYAQYYYDRAGRDKGDFGNISDRLKLREDLNCKSFGWYIENIYPELVIPSESIAHGEIRNVGYGNKMCLDAPKDRESDLIVYTCHMTGGTQFWEYKEGLLKKDNYCIEFNPQLRKLVVRYCKENSREKNQIWTFRNETQQFHQRSIDRCLEMTADHKLIMNECNEEEEGQKWELEHLHPEMLKEFL